MTTFDKTSADTQKSSSLSRAKNVVEYFVHPALRQAAPDTLYRARVLVGLLLTFTGFNVLTCLFLPFLELPPANLALAIPICFAAFLVTSTLLIYLWRRGRYDICCNVVGVAISLVTVIGIGISGGITRSPASQLLMVPPLLSYFFGGLRAGNRASLLSLLIVVAFSLAEFHGVQIVQVLSTTRDIRTVRLLICVINVLFIAALAFAYEITAAKLRHERDLEHLKARALAETDVLTGLFNRRTFESSLEHRVESCAARNPPRPFGLCCIDLDGFKPINDQHGHKIGDEVLRVIAERLRDTFRGSDSVGRHGGDEFLVIFDATERFSGAIEERSVETLAERLLNAIRMPVETSAGLLQVSASLGFSFYPRNGRSAGALKNAADSAMYEAKSAGGSAWRIAPSIHEPTPAEEKIPSPPALVTEFIPPAVAPADANRRHATNFPKLVDLFLHPSLRTESGSMSRGRILVMGMLLSFVAIIGAMIALAMEPHVSLHLKFVGTEICVVCCAIVVALLALLRLRGSYAACSFGMVLMVYSGVLSGVFISGGPGTSEATQLLALPPMLACLCGGLRGATAMVAIVLATIGIFAVLEISGVSFISLLDPAGAKLGQVITTLLGISFSFGWAFIYEFVTANLQRERDYERKVVERLAQTDALTGLANRLKFNDELNARVSRFGGPKPETRFTLCCIDLDGFKPINDRYGHAVGDEVLKAISTRLHSCTRDGDVVCRQGGDEFMVLFDSVTHEDQTEPVAQRLLSAITQPIATSAGPIRINASLGFAVFPDDSSTEDAMKNVADKAMYVAKQQRSGWKTYRSVFQPAPPFPSARIAGPAALAFSLKA